MNSCIRSCGRASTLLNALPCVLSHFALPMVFGGILVVKTPYGAS
jgi:hypothetical protein